MKLLVITKRRTSGHDIVEERFGRYYHLAVSLAARGHEIMVVAADYGDVREDVTVAGTRFVTIPLKLSGVTGFMNRVRQLAKDFAPEVVLAGGDTHLGWIGRRIGGSLGRPFVFDVFDNLRSFASARVPGVTRLLRSIINDADLVVTVSRGLRETVPHDRVVVIPNGVDMDLFMPVAQRVEGAVPQVGYVGGLAPHRGIDTLVEAVGELRRAGIGARLLLAGSISGGLRMPSHEWVDYRGALPQTEIPAFLGEIDVAVLPYPDTSWARYTSPYKLQEYLACEVPVVVTDVSDFRSMVTSDLAVCRPSDPRDLARALSYQLEHRVTQPRSDKWSWSARAQSLELELQRVIRIDG